MNFYALVFLFCFTEKVQARAQPHGQPRPGTLWANPIKGNLRQRKQKQTQFLGDSFKGKHKDILNSRQSSELQFCQN